MTSSPVADSAVTPQYVIQNSHAGRRQCHRSPRPPKLCAPEVVRPRRSCLSSETGRSSDSAYNRQRGIEMFTILCRCITSDPAARAGRHRQCRRLDVLYIFFNLNLMMVEFRDHKHKWYIVKYIRFDGGWYKNFDNDFSYNRTGEWTIIIPWMN